MSRKILLFPGRILFWILTRVEVAGGLEYIPRAGAAIIVVNHIGCLEVPLIFPFVKRKDLTEWVALIEGKNGAMYSASKMGTPIIPVAITRT